MMHKRDALAAELLRCQRELQALGGTGARYLGAEEAEAKKTLIITTGDVSDVDGFFALAEYAKTEATVLFIMNYPHYVGVTTHTPSQENKLGLGYTYDEGTYIQASEKSLTEKGASLESYRALIQKYTFTDGEGTRRLFNMHTALTDMAFHMAKKVWEESCPTGRALQAHNKRFFFCIGGINSINPFNAPAIKNELFVYADHVAEMTTSKTQYVQNSLYNHAKDPLKGSPNFINTYSDIYIDFNGSLAFLDQNWNKALTMAAHAGKIKAVVVAGGVYSDAPAQTALPVPDVLNRLSCATMNQLYHPHNTHEFFCILKTQNVHVFMVPNNQVVAMDTKEEKADGSSVVTDEGWTSFLASNGLNSHFLKSISDAYYNGVYKGARKPFDYYTALVISHMIKGEVPIQTKKTLHFDTTYGAVTVSNPNKDNIAAVAEYSKHLTEKPGVKLEIAQKEIATLEATRWTSLPVKVGEFTLDTTTYKLNLHVTVREPDVNAPWFNKKFGNTIAGRSSIEINDTSLPMIFKTQEDYEKWIKIGNLSPKDQEAVTRPLKKWAETTKKNFTLNFVVVQSIDMFGPLKMGFMKVHADIFDAQGSDLPSIALLRGGSVGILVVLTCNGTEYTVITQQARAPIGMKLLEIPAGMLDGDNNFAGAAAKELKEEIGLEISRTTLSSLTNPVYKEQFQGVYPSPGGCDEFIELFLYEEMVSDDKLNTFRGRVLGESSEGEEIKTEVIPLNDLIEKAPDMKSLSALMLYLYKKNNYIILQYQPIPEFFTQTAHALLQQIAREWILYDTRDNRVVNSRSEKALFRHLIELDRIAPDAHSRIKKATAIQGITPDELRQLKIWNEWTTTSSFTTTYGQRQVTNRADTGP
jgi:ADP-sugar diphosphatase